MYPLNVYIVHVQHVHKYMYLSVDKARVPRARIVHMYTFINMHLFLFSSSLQHCFDQTTASYSTDKTFLSGIFCSVASHCPYHLDSVVCCITVYVHTV